MTISKKLATLAIAAALEYHYEFVFKPEVIVPTVVR